ncbi:Metallo-beta-lactamase superfamily (plasmid) [Rubrobacter radiotolerans]|uniref:MBL fold metallo-hydrolase n=1 Tax=Rubrobacter radiotolerans TaxID=42256 RepID=A0A023X736_RUBRA|nr:MBL fold metallo-hydrolase [Rubrobacter radiotolerans]AHY48257.1 Metallo-beta-lactamase superfamily [Rubrobacter radiotolerans]MDX5895530.1 MBL fold metallo-hydrolase [Rubrobacter radiotolerans]SMC01454.1 Glyoxylase, beta-lactamase superfamily II [Rubrobacter radiotolerans DSM 5868]
MSKEKTEKQLSGEGNGADQGDRSGDRTEARSGNAKTAKGGSGTTEYLFEQFRVPRGCLGYAIADPETNLAALVDPELEMIEPMLDFLFEHALRPRYIIDTHTHADHISGAKELKAKTTAKLVMHEKAPASGVDLRVRDGEKIYLGDLEIEFLYTPGHAKDLVSVLLPGRLLTADALLIGSCGRTDLLNGDATQQYHTLYHTLKSLPDDLEIWPGHDYKGRSYSKLGDEKQNNEKMKFASEAEFVHYMDQENPGKLDPVYQLAESLKANML